MQSAQDKSNKLQALKEKLTSSSCKLCGNSLFPKSYIIHNLENKKYYVECSSCLTVYTHKLEIKYVGMPDVHGVS